MCIRYAARVLCPVLPGVFMFLLFHMCHLQAWVCQCLAKENLIHNRLKKHLLGKQNVVKQFVIIDGSSFSRLRSVSLIILYYTGAFK